MDFETIWYEAFPYLYGLGGVVAVLIRPGSLLLKLSGGLLVVASISTVRLRRFHRRAAYARIPTAADLARSKNHCG